MSLAPFHVEEGFLSPLRCEQLREQLALSRPDVDERGRPLKHERHVPDDVAAALINRLDLAALEARFGMTPVADQRVLFQQYWEDQKAPAEPQGVDGWRFTRRRWTQLRSIDLVGVLWLKTFHASVPLDPRTEVYGGKLEFPTFDFSLLPTTGTLVVFPATPHFVNAVSHVLVGSLEQVRFSLRLPGWTYDPARFSGTYRDWFFD